MNLEKYVYKKLYVYAEEWEQFGVLLARKMRGVEFRIYKKALL